MLEKKLRLTLVSSISGRLPRHIATVHSLGLKRINQVVEVKDNFSIRGMVEKVAYLLKIEEM
ncbi:50S ribosomal protein L30 [Rickettsiella grylli]|uniref:Large ribosomal subunit protein uL30 n=1 Tax=Rickettsiella grylli TaxID=59196 RepID=A8PNN6_9COXI|nr:50S ribosomal protein L30 [Rickettsiella grylli]EDP46393.1 ribosomal protein L30 [Rickettsiella grylli]